jgi:hypothetical protein
MRSAVCRLFLVLSLVIPGLVLNACDSSGSGGGGGLLAGGGIGGTGITSGSITGFGSVFVNGVEFDTSGSSFDVDDDAAAIEGDLGIGMVVTVTGSINADGLTGSADSIEYDDELEGPIAGIPVEDADMVTKTFDVFDTTVIVEKNSTVFVNTDYDSLAQDDLVEISGYFDANGDLLSTRLEKEGDLVLGASEAEIKGTVSGCPAGGCTGTFTLGAVTVTYDGSTDLSEVPGGVIDNGDYVEVKGTLVTATSVTASRIELEDEGFGDDVDEISIEGIVTDFNGIDDFRVAGQRVDALGAAFEPAPLAATIGDGDKVEVEGPIVGGTLQANEVEQRGGDVRISAVVVSRNVAAGTVTLEVVSGQPEITVSTDTQTQIEDDRDGVEPFGIADIAPGDFLDVKAYVDDTGTLIATQIERDDLDDTELRGPADVPPTAGTGFAGSVSVLGITIATDAGTGFEDINDDSIAGAIFFTQVTDGDQVAYKDKLPVNGIADEVEFED